ncbi:MAG: SPFH domain-containing protein [Candidatus Heimdallarchaeum aukensis]|uniref:SPFH domain-containing protein n=1 Tax=Candidatus Heimdallarchaeum aukensis TaxID=2876573 RepID=A0A9Y1FLU8_9ARCH|nr:MAG: SPFH domain-containing protein [Candidatus Heimdallarchaeum aukensis]
MSYIVKLGLDEKQENNVTKSELSDELVAWVFPYALEKWEKINLKKRRQILVKLNEKALVYNKENFIQELSSGLYKVNRKEGLEDHKIVFLEKNLITLKWGITQMQGVLTSDNIKVGASGTVSLTLSGAEVFVLNVLKNKTSFSKKELRPIINNIVKSALREVFPQYSIEELQKLSKDELLMFFEPIIVEELQKIGFSSQDISLGALGIPPEYRIF